MSKNFVCVSAPVTLTTFNFDKIHCGKWCPGKKQFIDLDKFANKKDSLMKVGVKKYMEIMQKA